MPRSAGPSSHYNPRMHQGGKLSFRRRIQDGVENPGDRLLLGGEDPPPLAELVPPGYPRVEVEIGPGKGAFLLAATAARPDTFLLGIEAAAAYASHAATKLHQSGRSNGLLLVDNGKLYLRDRVPPQSLHAVHVYYPDPWPKRRHRGRRFFTDEVRDTLADVLVDDGLLLIATDNPAYAGAIVRVLGSAPAFERDTTAEQQLQALGPGFAFSPTNFEKKYLEAGRILRRYAFRRVAR